MDRCTIRYEHDRHPIEIDGYIVMCNGKPMEET